MKGFVLKVKQFMNEREMLFCCSFIRSSVKAPLIRDKIKSNSSICAPDIVRGDSV